MNLQAIILQIQTMGTITVNSDYYAIWGKNPEPKEIKLADVPNNFDYSKVIGMKIVDGTTFTKLNGQPCYLDIINPAYDGQPWNSSKSDYKAAIVIDFAENVYKVSINVYGKNVICEGSVFSNIIFTDEFIEAINTIGVGWHLKPISSGDTYTDYYSTITNAIIFTYYDI